MIQTLNPIAQLEQMNLTLIFILELGRKQVSLKPKIKINIKTMTGGNEIK